MNEANEIELEWSLRGPDEDGAVWLSFPLEFFNLGPAPLVRDRIARFLDSLYSQSPEREVDSWSWTLQDKEGFVILSWNCSSQREDVDLGHLEPVTEALAIWLSNSRPE